MASTASTNQAAVPTDQAAAPGPARRPTWFQRFTTRFSTQAAPTVSMSGVNSFVTSPNVSPNEATGDIFGMSMNNDNGVPGSATAARNPRGAMGRNASLAIGRGGPSYGAAVAQHGGLKGAAGPAANWGRDQNDLERDQADAELNEDEDEIQNCQWGVGLGAMGSFMT